MQFSAKAKNLPISPFKLRPLADVVRGKKAQYALQWLATYPSKRVRPLKKLLESAVANAKNIGNVEVESLVVKTIFVDQGRVFKYFKPGAMGRAGAQQRRFCHANIVLEQIDTTQKKQR